jgi:two-component system, OmpR family, sensor kinase
LSALEREVQRLSRLVDGLLTLSRADGDRPQRGPVDVLAVIDERVETWSPLAHERGVRLSAIEGRVRDPIVSLVAGDLDQILDNLLANALDATPEGRSITVEVGEAEGGVDVVVSDEGPGMSDAERARAFDRFWQGPRHKGGSSGLGLAIVRQLARRNEAEVELEGRPGGDGGPGGDDGPGGADGSGGGGGSGGNGQAGPGLRAEVHLTR